jgi:hypothetical protein
MKKYKIQKPDPEIALKLLTYTDIRQLGYENDKDFCIKAIKNKHAIYEELPNKLRNDKDILNATIENAFDMSFIRSIPKRYQNQKVLDQLIDSNLNIGYESLESIINTFGSSSHREKNILRGIKKTKNPLKTSYEKYKSCEWNINPNPYPLVNKKTGIKMSLFDKYFICLGDMHCRADAYDSFQDIKFKKIALSLSPEAAFEFLLNDEISESQFAEIFANHFVKYTSRGYFSNNHWIGCECLACLGLNWKKFTPSNPEKEFRLKKIVINHILMKTKSLHKICVFLNFNEEFRIPGIINILKKKLNIESKKTTLLENIKSAYHYGELIVCEELKTRSFLSNNKSLAEKFTENKVVCDVFDKLFIIEDGQNIYLENIDEEVFINKAFIKNILSLFEKSYNDPYIVSKKDIWLSQTAAKYINKFKDLKLLKQIIYFQSQEPSKCENIIKYIRKDIKKEIIEYYLIQNYSLLPYSNIKSPKIIFNEAYIKKIETKFSINRDTDFYTKLVNAYGIKAFKNCDDRCYIPDKYKNNKDFMINAVLKSYTTLRHASDKIKSDPDVVYIAYLKSKNSFKSASMTLKKDKQFLDSLFSNPITKFHNAHHSIKTDKDICVPAINFNINVVKDLSIRMIKKLNMNWFSDIQRERIYEEYVRKSGTDDVFLIAAMKHKFLSP